MVPRNSKVLLEVPHAKIESVVPGRAKKTLGVEEYLRKKVKQARRAGMERYWSYRWSRGALLSSSRRREGLGSCCLVNDTRLTFF